MLTIKKRLKQLRLQRGLSQLELAMACDPPLTQGAIGHLETGRRPGRWDTLSRVAMALEVSMEDLFRPQPIPVIALAEAGPDGYHLADHAIGAGFSYLERPVDVEHEDAYGLEVNGDSMVPALYHGWKIIVIPERPRSRSLAVVGLCDGQKLIKRVKYEHERLLLESTNPAYDPIVLGFEEVEFIHRVVWIKPT